MFTTGISMAETPKFRDRYERIYLQGTIPSIFPKSRQSFRSPELKAKGYDETWGAVARFGDDDTGGFMVWLDRLRADPKLGKVSVDVEMELFFYADPPFVQQQRQSFKEIPQTENLVYEAGRPISMAIYSITDAEWDTLVIKLINFFFNPEKGFDIDFKILVTPQGYGLHFQHKVVQDWNTLFTDQMYGDVSICVGEKEFKVDRGILSVRSPVFAAMFKSEKNNTVNIDDIKAEVVGEMLRYIYTGTIPMIDRFPGGLLVAAVKYQIEDLKEECSKYLAATITVDKAVDVVVLGHLYNFPKLKKKGLSFIKKNGKEVKKTIGWKTVIPKHPDLMMELFDKIW